MKNLLLMVSVLTSFLGFSQEINKPQQKAPLFITTGNIGNFDKVYNRLNVLTDNISDTTIAIENLDDLRQGQLVISTRNFGKSFESINIDPRPSLNIEAQRIMFSGNNVNPFRRNPIVIKQ